MKLGNSRLFLQIYEDKPILKIVYFPSFAFESSKKFSTYTYKVYIRMGLVQIMY